MLKTIKKAILLLAVMSLLSVPLMAGQSRKTHLRVAAAGDWAGNANTRRNLERMAQMRPDAVFAIGDLSYGEITPESKWVKFVKQHLGANVPVELIPGNHESEDNGQGDIEEFARLLPDHFGARGHYPRNYYVDLPMHDPLLRVIAISPDLDFKDKKDMSYELPSVEGQWLESALNEAASKKIPWIFVMMHKNFISAGTKSAEVPSELFNYLIRKGVHVILQGHDHTYQRTYPMSLSQGCLEIPAGVYNERCLSKTNAPHFKKDQGTILVISAAMGKELYPVNEKDPELMYFADYHGENRGAMYGFSFFDISSDRIRARFISPGKDTHDLSFSIDGKN